MAALGAIGGGSASAAEPLTAPPASSAAVATCSARAAESAKDADVEHPVSGRALLRGCISDTSGIAHLFIEWRSERGRVGRICVDPPVRGTAWQCVWDTTRLRPGSYRVTMVAVDAAGNRGSSDQAYRVLAAEPPPRADPPGASAPAEPPTVAPVPAPADPGPAPSDPPPPDDQPSTGRGAEGGPEEDDGTLPPAAAPPGAQEPLGAVPVPVPEPAPTPPPSSSEPTLAARFVQERTEECARLELAPGVRADRALSLAVLECMRPALELVDATALTLDEIPVPPAIEVVLPDAASRDAARELLPERVGGVELTLVIAPETAPDSP